MNPETADDRLAFVQDFGETCTVTPVAGGGPFAIQAIFNNGPLRSTVDLDAHADTSVVGSDPHLELPKEERAKIRELDLVDVPSQAPTRYRIGTIEPEDIDGGFYVAQVLEA